MQFQKSKSQKFFKINDVENVSHNIEKQKSLNLKKFATPLSSKNNGDSSHKFNKHYDIEKDNSKDESLNPILKTHSPLIKRID